MLSSGLTTVKSNAVSRQNDVQTAGYRHEFHVSGGGGVPVTKRENVCLDLVHCKEISCRKERLDIRRVTSQ